MNDAEPLLRVDDLRVSYRVRTVEGMRRWASVDAVRGVSLSLDRGETLALVGESGCGKSTTGRAILRLLSPSGGRIEFMGQEIQDWSQRRLRPLRRHMSMIFQDPRSSLNPRRTVGDAVMEVLVSQEMATSTAGMQARVRDVLEMVGLPTSYADRYPHELSGGQRQRVGIARAMVSEPALVVCDEPTASLDVSIQAQVLNVLKDIQEQTGVSYLYISHDLATVRFMADRVAVMYLGGIVETAKAADLVAHQHHPYSESLLKSVLEPTPGTSVPEDTARGEVPSLLAPPSGCSFHSRCGYAQECCRMEAPPVLASESGGSVACYFPIASDPGASYHEDEYSEISDG